MRMYNMLHVCTHVSWHGPDRSSSRERDALCGLAAQSSMAWPAAAGVYHLAPTSGVIARERDSVLSVVAYSVGKALHGGDEYSDG